MRVFDTAEIPGIAVQETRATTINVTLKLGKASESVEVTANPMLNATDGYTLDSAQIELTPLATGSFTQHAVLSPGVAKAKLSRPSRLNWSASHSSSEMRCGALISRACSTPVLTGNPEVCTDSLDLHRSTSTEPRRAERSSEEAEAFFLFRVYAQAASCAGHFTDHE